MKSNGFITKILLVKSKKIQIVFFKFDMHTFFLQMLVCIFIISYVHVVLIKFKIWLFYLKDKVEQRYNSISGYTQRHCFMVEYTHTHQ